jgi:hypothetical protein
MKHNWVMGWRGDVVLVIGIILWLGVPLIALTLYALWQPGR